MINPQGVQSTVCTMPSHRKRWGKEVALYMGGGGWCYIPLPLTLLPALSVSRMTSDKFTAQNKKGIYVKVKSL